MTHIEIQTRNYWFAIAAINGRDPVLRKHAIAMLDAQAGCAALGTLSDLAMDALLDLNERKLSLWMGSRA